MGCGLRVSYVVQSAYQELPYASPICSSPARDDNQPNGDGQGHTKGAEKAEQDGRRRKRKGCASGEQEKCDEKGKGAASKQYRHPLNRFS